MHRCEYIESARSLFTVHTIELLTAIHEAKGRQSVRIEAYPELVDTLVSVARIQSTDASNRIEGISTSDHRLQELIRETTTPRNRNEEEIAGYRDVLTLIHENHDYIPLTPNVILQLHRDLFRHTPLTFGGHFKDTDNIIVERLSDGTQSVRFTPPSSLITPQLIEQACEAYRAATDGTSWTDPLLATIMFIFDFTCVHPFNDGNGRMSRLLTLLLLYRSGFNVGKYISLEHIIEQTKDAYYDALAASTKGWNENSNDYKPFVDYMLGVILTAYRDFDERMNMIVPDRDDKNLLVTSLNGSPTKDERIQLLFDRTLKPMSKRDVLTQLPDISISTVERVLKRMLDEGILLKIGSGRATRYVKQREPRVA